ncbi:hypothetical protein [Steroidobacter cummioxidans]|uniref:hypothetical protein n=1 Tax=Steroidobacter cummioxidans TaxID=1803913 RepID=UPI000E31A45B|nr:hypothetical protein [Steroidobacter cummioxidans]
MPRTEQQTTSPTRWPHFREDLGVLLWASFLAACVATLLFFACFDPQLLVDDAAPPAWLADRRAGYTVGFFFFWMMSAIASFLTAYLIETRSGTADREHR